MGKSTKQRGSRSWDGAHDGVVENRGAPGKQTRSSLLPAIQRKGSGSSDGISDLHAVADAGVDGAGDSLPFGSRIQSAFGRHDVSGVKTQTGGAAREASSALGASAYAFGSRIGFASTPNLHTAAHEAAHVVQQRSGVSLYGGIGAAGDAYEQHADRVADLVVAGKSAETTLDEMSGSGRMNTAVQRQESDEPGECQQPEEQAEDSFAGDPVAALREALEQGIEELSRVARQIPVPDLTDALELVPEIRDQLLAYWWPNHTGWSVTVKAKADGSADFLVSGVPLSAAIEGAGSVTFIVRRTDTALVLEFKPTLEGRVEGAGTIKLLELPIGTFTTAASTLKLTTDLGRVDWSVDAITFLKNGDFRGALTAVLETGMSLGKNTQLESTMDVQNGMDGAIQAGLGDHANGFVKAAVALGLKLELKNPTETDAGRIRVEGSGSTMAQLGLEGDELPSEAPAVIKLIKKLVEFEATAKSKATVRLDVSLPKLASAEEPEPGGFGLSVSILGGFAVGGKLVGQEGEVGATHEIRLGLDDIPAFIESLENGTVAEAGNNLAAGSGYGLQLDASLDLAKIGLIDALATWFPSLAGEKFPEKLSAKIEAKFFLAADRIADIAGDTSALWMEFFQAASEGGFEDALVAFADLALENVATMLSLVEKFKIQFSSTLFNKDGALKEQLGVGDVGAGGGASVAAVFERELTHDDLGLGDFEKYLRAVIGGERAE